jgi:DNA/RNA-binding domain of Phe-tRNA-synthetase-like protein
LGLLPEKSGLLYCYSIFYFFLDCTDEAALMAGQPSVAIDPELGGVVRLAVLYCDNLKIDNGEKLWAVFCPFCAEVARRYEGRTISAVENIQTARELYRSIGVDPTRNRPSSEALTRRLIKGKELYRINSLVDTINYCSLSYMLPLGLYDLDNVRGDSVVLRKGVAGEGYAGIGKDWVNLEGRYSMFDSTGPFGSPTADSDRSKITDQTGRALIVIFAPWSVPPEKLEEYSVFTAKTVKNFGGGSPDVHQAGLVQLKPGS